MEDKLGAVLRRTITAEPHLLIELITKASRQITIIIDNAHLCSQESFQLLRELLGAELPNLTILLGSRYGLRKRFSKAIVNNIASYLDGKQLAFTEDEILRMLSVSKGAAKALHDEFDGWPLAYVLLKRQPLRTNRQTTSGELLSHMPDVFNEFVDSEVIEQISHEQIHRAVEISVIDRYEQHEPQSICGMSAHKCDAVFQALKMFRFEEGAQFQLNRVVRDALRRRAWLEFPKLMHDLCLRASKYYWYQDDLVTALAFATGSGAFACKGRES